MSNWSKIKEHIEKVESWSPNKEIPYDHFEYIDISSINRLQKCIDTNAVLKILGENAPSRARQKIKTGDILVSTVRPNLNGIALVDNGFINGTASTGYCVLRPKSNLHTKYLFYWLQTKAFVEDMTNKASGASYPAVSDKIIKESKIPLPPLETQKKNAEILDAADTLRQKTKTLIEKYDQLTQSLFMDMFGNPVSNKLNWDKQSLDEVTYKITDGKHGDCSNQDNSGYYFISAKDIVNGYLCYDNARQITKKDFDEVDKRTSLEEGDILISNSGTLGKVAIANDPVKTRKTTFQKSVAILKINPKYLIPIYTKYLLTHDKNSLIKNSTGSSQKNLLISQIKGYQIITPPIPLQNQFAERVQAIEEQKAKARASLEKSEELFQSLLQRAFNGKLV